MNKKDFKNISMTGRYAYALLCIEKIFSEKFKEKDFCKVFEVFWRGTEDSNWDTISEFALDLTSDSLFSSSTFNEDNFFVITNHTFDYYYNLFIDMKDISNICFSALYDLMTVYENTTIPGYGSESIDSLFEIINLLDEEEVDLPDIKKVSFSSFSELNGWGKSFYGNPLSIILNN